MTNSPRPDEIPQWWLVRHQIVLRRMPHPSDVGEFMWRAWREQDEDRNVPGYVGTGDTAEAAVRELAASLVLPLWNDHTW